MSEDGEAVTRARGAVEQGREGGQRAGGGREQTGYA